MKEFKFRIFDKKNKKILEIDALFINEAMFKPVGGDEYSVWNYDTEYYSSPMQYTGLKDKNGVEIYEGDIVIQYEIPNKPFEIKQLIFFSDGMFCVGKKDEIETPLYLETKTHYRGKDVNLIEVVGNIYENPELLDTKGE